MLDHPTLPDLLPGLVSVDITSVAGFPAFAHPFSCIIQLKSILATFASIGYSRCIRWTLALVPALKMLVLDPLVGYFFEHIEEDEGMMKLAESVGMLTPERKRNSLYGSTGSIGAFAGAGGSMRGSRHFFHRLNSDGFNTSQIGLSFDAPSPTPSRFALSSTSSMEGGPLMDAVPLPPSLHQPNFTGMAMENSPLRRREKSVHFGLFDSDGGQGKHTEMVKGSSVGYSLSTNELNPGGEEEDGATTDEMPRSTVSFDDMVEMYTSDGVPVKREMGTSSDFVAIAGR